jgi:hypothetical protein
MMRGLMILAAAGLVAGCATTDAADKAAPAHVGKTASQERGAAILKDSGARTLRWGPPRGAWTMDYRQDRVNVRYDEGMVITGITCG